MKFQVYKQTYTHSCLVVCFLLLLQLQKGIDLDEKVEEEIYLKGTKRIYPYYFLGVIAETVKKFKTPIDVFVDNKYFTELVRQSASKDIIVRHEKVTLLLLKKLLKENPIICQIDGHYLEDYSHYSHFIVLTKFQNGRFTYLDPGIGKRGYMRQEKLEEAIVSLRQRLQMAPLVFLLS